MFTPDVIDLNELLRFKDLEAGTPIFQQTLDSAYVLLGVPYNGLMLYSKVSKTDPTYLAIASQIGKAAITSQPWYNRQVTIT